MKRERGLLTWGTTGTQVTKVLINVSFHGNPEGDCWEVLQELLMDHYSKSKRDEIKARREHDYWSPFTR